MSILINDDGKKASFPLIGFQCSKAVIYEVWKERHMGYNDGVSSPYTTTFRKIFILLKKKAIAMKTWDQSMVKL